MRRNNKIIYYTTFNRVFKYRILITSINLSFIGSNYLEFHVKLVIIEEMSRKVWEDKDFDAIKLVTLWVIDV